MVGNEESSFVSEMLLQETIWVLQTRFIIGYWSLLSWCLLPCTHLLLTFSCRFTMCRYICYFLVLFFVAKRRYRFQENGLMGLARWFCLLCMVFEDGVTMFLFLYSSLLLYLTLNFECFDMEQICFSFLMVYLSRLMFSWLPALCLPYLFGLFFV